MHAVADTSIIGIAWSFLLRPPCVAADISMRGGLRYLQPDCTC
jgi:hypothetical protein